ncbi:MAG: CPBP family intramembrane glutamic endopeptidase [Vicinamibacteria bacterium]
MSLSPVSLVGWIFIAFVGVVVPWAVLRNRDGALAMASIPLQDRFVAMLIPQLFLGALAVGTGYVEEVGLFPPRWPSLTSWGAGVAFMVVALLLIRPYWRRSVEQHKPAWRLFAPTNDREGRMWIALSLAAGVAEELVWRGVLPALLLLLTGSLIASIVLSVVSFALAHAIQGARSVLAIGTIAAAFHALVWLSGSLYVAMTVHFIYDVIAGFTYAKFARDLGLLRPEGWAAPAPAADALP